MCCQNDDLRPHCRPKASLCFCPESFCPKSVFFFCFFSWKSKNDLFKGIVKRPAKSIYIHHSMHNVVGMIFCIAFWPSLTAVKIVFKFCKFSSLLLFFKQISTHNSHHYTCDFQKFKLKSVFFYVLTFTAEIHIRSMNTLWYPYTLYIYTDRLYYDMTGCAYIVMKKTRLLCYICQRSIHLTMHNVEEKVSAAVWPPLIAWRKMCKCDNM